TSDAMIARTLVPIALLVLGWANTSRKLSRLSAAQSGTPCQNGESPTNTRARTGNTTATSAKSSTGGTAHQVPFIGRRLLLPVTTTYRLWFPTDQRWIARVIMPMITSGSASAAPSPYLTG